MDYTVIPVGFHRKTRIASMTSGNQMIVVKDCKDCNGRGYIGRYMCQTCHGSGKSVTLVHSRLGMK